MAVPTRFPTWALPIWATRRLSTLCAVGFATLIATCTAIATCTTAFAQAADPVIAKVNGVEIRQSDLTAAEAVWSGRAEHAFNPAGGLHHALPERGRKLGRDQPAEQVVRPAGREMDDDGDGTIRPFGPRRAAGQQRNRNA